MSARDPPFRRQLLIQIDGLARPLLERAVQRDTVPRLARLISDEDCALHSVYTGLPSTTPAVQGEFFYARRAPVPAFAYLHDRHTARHMMDPAAADAVQRTIEVDTRGLLEGGACYCDIYTGGAERARFCPAGLRRGMAPAPRGLAYQLRSLGAYAAVAVRASGMIAGEAVRLLSRRMATPGVRFNDRLKGAWDRIVFSVVLRDSARLAAVSDLRERVPVVHVNFLGYDVQAHRYGPESAPAGRALKGIDHAIASLLREFRNADGPDGTAIVYSDHGQEATTALVSINGRPIERIVRDACASLPPADSAPADPTTHRSINRTLGEAMLGVDTATSTDDHGRTVTTVGSGPIAHVYLDPRFTVLQRGAAARLVADRAAGVAVIWRDQEDRPLGCLGVSAPVPLDRFCAERLVSHPFRDAVAPDLERLLLHPDAGDLILLGTGFSDAPVTFANERGSHGGPGRSETHAFVIAPRRIALGAGPGPLRFEDLRAALLSDRDDHH